MLKLTTALILMCLTLSACGGGDGSQADAEGGGEKGTKTFEGDGFSFRYPEDWVTVDYAESNPDLIPPAASVSYGGSEIDSVAVTVASGQPSITADNLEGSLDGLADYATDAYGKLDEGPTPTTVDGLPAARLEASGPNLEGVPVEFRTTIALDGTTWYVIQSEFLPENADKIRPGYDEIVSSFQVE